MFFFTLLPRPQARAIAEAFGESERGVQAIVLMCLVLALAAATVWTLASFDPTLLAGTDPKTAGSERVLRAFIGLCMVLCLSVVAGISGLAHWMLATPHRAPRAA